MLVRSFCRPCALGLGSLPLLYTLVPAFPAASPFASRRIARRPRATSVGEVRGFMVRSSSISRPGSRVMSGTAGAGSTSAVMQGLTDCSGEIELLPAVNDDYEGVIVEITHADPMDPGVFLSSLRASILVWRQQKKRGVWIKLPIQHSNLVHPAIQEGFWYHHAEPGYVMLVYWIPSTEHTLPVNASHRVGVGGLVINERKEILVVQEKSGKLRGKAVWKLPTGVVSQGEDILVGAVREVKEETGIDAEFEEVVAFRQSHKSFFDKSDLFFICLLRPISFDIKIQESEIEAAKWMPIEEFAAQPFVIKHELLKYIADIALSKNVKEYTGFSPVGMRSAFSDGRTHLYVNIKDLTKTPASDNDAQADRQSRM